MRKRNFLPARELGEAGTEVFDCFAGAGRAPATGSGQALHPHIVVGTGGICVAWQREYSRAGMEEGRRRWLGGEWSGFPKQRQLSVIHISNGSIHYGANGFRTKIS